MRQLILAAAIIIAVLSAVWFTQPRLSDSLNTQSETSSSQDKPAEEISSDPDAPHSTQSADAHDSHDHDHDGELPPELEEYIESQRIPASEIPITVHGDGTATAHTGKQYSTVMMMIIDEDGTRRMVERQITPEGTLVIPNE